MWSKQIRAGRGRRPRAVAIALALVLAVLVAVGCGGSDSDSDAAGGGSPDASPHVGKRLAIVRAGAENYYLAATCGALEEAERLGFDVGEPQGPKQFDPPAQVKVVNSVLARNPEALVFMPQDPKSALLAVQPAIDDGLKVATIDTNLEDPSAAVSFVATDHVAGGRAAAQELLREIGGKGKVLAHGVVPDHPITRGRIDGFESVIKSAPDVEYLGAHYPELDIAKIAADMAATLRAHPDITAVYTTQFYSTSGVVTALRDAGLDRKVKIVTWDYDDVGAKYLDSGDVSALVAQNPREMGRIAVQQLANAFDGKSVQKTINPPVQVVTQENKSEPEMRALRYAGSC